MEPMEIATGVSPRQKASTAEKHLVIILVGTTQFYLGDKPASTCQLPSLQSGSYLGMSVFFQFLHHYLTGILEQIDGTPFLGTLQS